ncbi:helix-turn-helix domain-containing protein [Lentzea flaviverrucosa]|uniref:Helix-turn-helix domain-containing protein n=1 Tax=Lentzea flaviverrucosa TaxID=200379 RepID=A0A1H9SW62_9PSEU|nr:helix-turn-helix transcriptional regulator [Lentzea flaviverrucosa]RDI25551.1 helix-turn-helix protein [Lentzea flaviverrucosa]SER89242.1 Helix-turn-helix domain-containing protein [Lentzea flaviverrucosa]
MPKRSSSVVGREFGNGVRAAIESTGLTQRQLAEELGWQEAKLSDMLAGKGGVNESEVRELLAYCRTPLEERERLIELFREQGNVFLQVPDEGVPDQVRTLINQEKEATEIIAWSMILVPGLLQIFEYIAAVTAKARTVSPENLAATVAARAARTEILEYSRTFTFYVHEQALWLPVGGEEVWREQLAHLLRLSVRKYISIRIVPRSVGMHAGVSGDFRLMKFPKYPPVVYVESVKCCLFFDDKDTVEVYENILKDLAAVALDEEESRAVINSILEGLP